MRPQGLKSLIGLLLIGGLATGYYLLVSNEDRYIPLLLEKIDLEDVTKTYEFDYLHKYIGTHAVVLASEKPIPIGSDYDSRGLQVEVELRSTSGKELLKDIVGHSYPFWGEQHSGMAILTYDVAEDLPRNEPITIAVHFSPESFRVLRAYELTKLLILKVSDK